MSRNALSDEKVVYYLAYGSNLSRETFLGRRGIRPLSSTNVVVPSLRLRFDLPGVPYAEPCFANSGPRENHDQELRFEDRSGSTSTEETPSLFDCEEFGGQDYHKDRWHKGLVGVVYGLTPADYAHVIATEGAGASYKDVTVSCYPLNPLDDKTPAEPTTHPLKAHTLFAPPADDTPGGGVRSHRSDPSYAQPSARYLKLITDGAAEHALPADYCSYLAQIRPYTITTTGQQIGRALFLAFWVPIVMLIFKLMGMVTDDRGRAPGWAIKLSESTFGACWWSYDSFFKKTFGDGERTITDGTTRLARRSSPSCPIGKILAARQELEKVETMKLA